MRRRVDRYGDYLASEHWLETRARKIEAVGRKCERCGEHARRIARGQWGFLHVHHLTYKRLGHERMEDLLVLCPVCHGVEHRRIEDTFEERERARLRHSKRVSGAVMVEYVEDDHIADEVAVWDRLAIRAGL